MLSIPGVLEEETLEICGRIGDNKALEMDRTKYGELNYHLT